MGTKTLEQAVRDTVERCMAQGYAVTIKPSEGADIGPLTDPDAVWSEISSRNLTTFALWAAEMPLQG